jgi:HlyD family secretion protein
MDLLEGKPAAYSPFRPGMTATVDIITKTKEECFSSANKCCGYKSDTAAVSDVKNNEPSDDKKSS